MNIDLNSKVTTNVKSTDAPKSAKTDSKEAKFSDELSNLSAKSTDKDAATESENLKPEKSKESEEEIADVTVDEDAAAGEAETVDELKASGKDKSVRAGKVEIENKVPVHIDEALGGLTDVVVQINNKLGHTDENSEVLLKPKPVFDDNKLKEEDNSLINNDMNVQELKEALAFQMNASMNFDSNGQAFSDLMENQKKNDVLSANAAELAEEKKILSSMDENIAIANRNRALAEAKVKTVTDSEGIKRVDKNTNITVENIVKFDDVIMNKADVEFFAKLAENAQAELTAETAKLAQVSKTLADLIAKSMKDNQPVRIDFDNNISVIIKIGKDGKISADFLPSSQVAEAYLKENLPLLRQRFDENNIEYDSLNQRERKQNEKENQKKGRKDE